MTQLDPIEVLRRYAPTTTTLSRDWDAARPVDAVADIVGTDVLDDTGWLATRRSRPTRHRLSTRVPVLVSVGVLGLAAAVLAAVVLSAVRGGDGYDTPAGGHGEPFDPPPGLSNRAIGASQYSYRVTEMIDLRTGKLTTDPTATPIDRTYVAASGKIISFRTGFQRGCYVFANPSPGITSPSVTWFAGLPTGVDALTRYLRARAEGSSSRDEAVFVSVGDMLVSADGLASPRLRAAMVGVLSRTPGVYLHRGDHDQLGRPALRLDFVDQRIRPGEVHAYYFDPRTFQFLEERDAGNSSPTRYAGPSPAYTAHPPAGADDPDVLHGREFVSVVRTETVVDHAPSTPATCQH